MQNLSDRKQQELLADYLKWQLQEKGLSAEALAKLMSEAPGQEKIDGGLVRAWVRGDRTPPLGSPYIKVLSEALDVPVKDLEGRQRESLKLREQQKLENKKRKRKERGLLEHYKDKPELENQTDFVNLPARNVKQISSVTEGRENLAELFLAKIEALLDPKIIARITESNRIILLTFHTREMVFTEQQFENWKQCLKSALDIGWGICHLIRLDRDWDRTLNFLASVLPFSSYNKYEIRSFNQEGVLAVPFGMMIVPSHEALIAFATENSDFIDTAICFQAKEKDEDSQKIVEKWEKYYGRVKKVETTPIYELLEDRNEVVKAFLDLDQRPGNRITYLDKISEINRPVAWYEPETIWAQALKQDDNLFPYIGLRKKRLIGLKERLEKYLTRHIYYESCLDKFDKSFYLKETDKERLEQLEEMRHLLWKYENYEVALLDEKEDIQFGFPDFLAFCEVQEKNSVMIGIKEMKKQAGKYKIKYFRIKDSHAIHAFEEGLSKNWNDIPDRNKDKIQVIKRLDEKIERLRASVVNKKPKNK